MNPINERIISIKKNYLKKETKKNNKNLRQENY